MDFLPRSDQTLIRPSCNFSFSLSLSFFGGVKFSIVIHCEVFPHSLFPQLATREGLFFSPKTFHFSVLLMLHINLKGRDVSNSPYLLTARLPWSLAPGLHHISQCFPKVFQNTQSICPLDTLGCSVDTPPTEGFPLTIPATKTAQHSSQTAVTQQQPERVC